MVLARNSFQQLSSMEKSRWLLDYLKDHSNDRYFPTWQNPCASRFTFCNWLVTTKTICDAIVDVKATVKGKFSHFFNKNREERNGEELAFNMKDFKPIMEGLQA